jgi:hypothetical protein
MGFMKKGLNAPYTLKLKEFSKRATFLMVNSQLNRSLERYE